MHALSFAALIFALTGNPLMAGTPTLPDEKADEDRSASPQRHVVQSDQTPAEDPASIPSSTTTLADISSEPPLVHQLPLFTQLANSLTTDPLTDESRASLKALQAELEKRILGASGVTSYNTGWFFLNNDGKRLQKSFLAGRHQHYTALALQAQEAELSLERPNETTPLRSEYLLAVAKAYGPERATRLLAEKSTEFGSAGIGYRYTALLNPLSRFPSSDPGLTPIWDHARPVLGEVYKALGEDFDPEKMGPVFLKAQDEGFPYSDEELKTFESFAEAYDVIPPAKRFPVRAGINVSAEEEAVPEAEGQIAPQTTPTEEKATSTAAEPEAATVPTPAPTATQVGTPAVLPEDSGGEAAKPAAEARAAKPDGKKGSTQAKAKKMPRKASTKQAPAPRTAPDTKLADTPPQ